MIIDMNYWGKVLKNLLILALSVLGCYLGFKLVIFYIPFLIAFIISLLLEPCIRFIMRKTKLRRKTSSIIIFIIAIIIIAGLLVWASITLVTEASNLLTNLNEYFEKGYQLVQNLIASVDFENGTEYVPSITYFCPSAKNSLTISAFSSFDQPIV